MCCRVTLLALASSATPRRLSCVPVRGATFRGQLVATETCSDDGTKMARRRCGQGAVRGHAMSHMGFELSDLATSMTSSIALKEPLPDFPGATRPNEFFTALRAPIYLTDAAGRITYFNEAAATMWGRRPKLNVDLWCGSWRLFWPGGTPMPHDAFPTAINLRGPRAGRGGP